jgi:uncharacterized protein YkwD
MNARMQWWLRALVMVMFAACGDPQHHEPAVGTNSNWLRACVEDSECDDAAMCQCGACTSQCSSDMDCNALGAAHCAKAGDPAVDAVCTADALGSAAGICLPSCEPGGCKEGQACVAGSCVLARVPDVAFCAPAAAPSAAERTHEDELLALVQQMRTQGGGTCGGAALPALRFDPRLLCDARVLAMDMARTRKLSLTDSEGHTTAQRMSSAGYAARQWGEAFALEANSATRALALMLSDSVNCTQLTSARIRDVGVGVSGDAYVATFGSE